MIISATFVVIGLFAIGTACTGPIIVLIFKVFLPEEYPKKGIATKKLLKWAFNYVVVGAGLLFAAFVARHLPLP